MHNESSTDCLVPRTPDVLECLWANNSLIWVCMHAHIYNMTILNINSSLLNWQMHTISWPRCFLNFSYDLPDTRFTSVQIKTTWYKRRWYFWNMLSKTCNYPETFHAGSIKNRHENWIFTFVTLRTDIKVNVESWKSRLIWLGTFHVGSFWSRRVMHYHHFKISSQPPSNSATSWDLSNGQYRSSNLSRHLDHKPWASETLISIEFSPFSLLLTPLHSLPLAIALI